MHQTKVLVENLTPEQIQFFMWKVCFGDSIQPLYRKPDSQIMYGDIPWVDIMWGKSANLISELRMSIVHKSTSTLRGVDFRCKEWAAIAQNGFTCVSDVMQIAVYQLIITLHFGFQVDITEYLENVK